MFSGITANYACRTHQILWYYGELRLQDSYIDKFPDFIFTSNTELAW